MVLLVFRVGEGHLHHIALVQTFVEEDVETSILEAFHGVYFLLFSIDLDSGAAEGVQQTLEAAGLNEFGHVGLEIEIDLDDIVGEFCHGFGLRLW